MNNYAKSTLIASLVALALILMSYRGEAQEVKYCIDPRTQDIFTILAGYPCPRGTHEL
jgi:hypothetical protein